MKPAILFALLGILLLASSAPGQSFVLPAGLSDVQRKRFQPFTTFQIKGVCGDKDLDRLATLGVNTVRGYTIGSPDVMRQKLDHAHRLGIKMILSEWMPHHGENRNNEGHVWRFDYNAKGDEMVKRFIEKIEAIGDHPAILMWGLGNEVNMDEPYLRTVNRMSQEIHKRFPHHLTSLTMINARPDSIAVVKKFAPDLDVLGIQSYSRGAVRGSIKKTEELWGKPFYMSEFNTNGPWNYGKTAWGVEFDEPASRKVSDLKDCYAAIDESPLCLGSTIFVWGHYATWDRPTYFGLLLDPNPEGSPGKDSFDHLLMTPQADVMAEHFTKQPIKGNRAPVISQLEFEGGARSKVVKPGEALTVRFAAQDTNGDTIEFVSWVLATKVQSTRVVAGPFAQTSSSHAVIPAPQKVGEYLILVYAKDNRGGASATVVPFKVTTEAGDPPPSGK
jgi:hypothetical protein